MFKRGQQVVEILNGAGFETASIHTVARVSRGRVQLEESDRWFDQNTGRDTEPGAFGFSTRIVPLEATSGRWTWEPK